MTILKKQRLILEKSQAEMAEEMGVSTGTYMRKERDPDGMTLKELKRFIAVTGCDPLDFFCEDNSTIVENKE